MPIATPPSARSQLGSSPERIIVVGLGNEFVSDDGVGIAVVRQLKKVFDRRGPGSWLSSFDFEIAESQEGGLRLLDLIAGFDNCIIVDAVQTGVHPPGTVYRYVHNADSGPVKLISSHQVSLWDVCGLGKILGIKVPDNIVVIGVEGSDVTTFAQQCTPEVRQAVPLVVERIVHELEGKNAAFGQVGNRVQEFPLGARFRQPQGEFEVKSVRQETEPICQS